jgi:hypothetical protein
VVVACGLLNTRLLLSIMEVLDYAAFPQLLEFGFQPTIARNTTYVYAGARTLPTVGVLTGQWNSRFPHAPLLAELIAACRPIYGGVALLAALALLGGGSLYISTLVHDDTARCAVLVAWVMYANGSILSSAKCLPR